MDWNELLNLLLGGGLAAALLKVLTLKAAVRQAEADADEADAEAEHLRIDNAGQATRILMENIVEPLKKELHETREELRETKKEFGATKREMARLRKAIGDASNCRHADDCPVLDRLRDLPKEESDSKHNRSGAAAGRQSETRSQGGEDRDTATAGGEPGHPG